MFHQPIVSAPSIASVSMPELIGAFSYALDITEGQPAGHAMRCAWIGGHIGELLGLNDGQLSDLHYTLLLKDLGCSSNAARICELYAADDLAFKRGYKTVGTSLAATLHFVFSRTARSSGWSERAGRIGNILANGKQIADEMILSRCTRGADVARTLGFGDDVCDGIYHLDEHWDGSGRPDRRRGTAIPLYARIALLAQIVDVFRMEMGRSAAIEEVRRRSGSWLDPELASLLLGLSEDDGFWRALESPALDSLLSARMTSAQRPADEDFLDAIASAFGQVVDAKSPFTAGHSLRVADYAIAIARKLNVPQARRSWLRRGALLHDIGKLGVSNAILDKPGKLDDAEWRQMRDHAAHTQEILGRVGVLADLAPIAAAHHERLDGKGYPLGLGEAQIGRDTRIITICDFYDALTADRPYRAAMSTGEALSIIGSEVGHAVDPDCFDALQSVVRNGA